MSELDPPRTGPEVPLEADFEEVFRDAYWPLVRTLTVAAGDRELAADCVADAFERAYARWRRIRRYEDPVGWVRRVAINRLRDHARRAGRRDRAIERLGPPESAWAPEPAPFDLAAALASLPEQQRIAAALFYVDDLSVEEIAQAMGRSAGTVKFHLHAARSALRPLLTPLASDE
jgi:RNA polymerase sigma-70 factor (ECF subfamily)